MDQFLNIVQTYGFPAALCVWYIYQGHKDSVAIHKALTELSRMLDNYNQVLEKITLIQKWEEKVLEVRT